MVIGLCVLLAGAAGIWFFRSKLPAIRTEKQMAEAGRLEEEGDYLAAHDIYAALGIGEKADEMSAGLGDEALKRGEYEAAAAYYREAGEKEKAGEISSRLFDEASDRDDPAAAYAAYGDCASPERSGRILEMIVSLRTSVDEETACRVAAGYGSGIRDVDGQLEYCEKLHEAGYDLEKVYPEGVAVDFAAGQYSVVNRKDEYVPNEKPVLRYLVLAMIEDRPAGGFYDVSGLEKNLRYYNTAALVDPHDKIAGDCYTVRLLPGQMYLLSEENRADSLSECTDLIIAERYYVRSDISCNYPGDEKELFASIQSATAEELCGLDKAAYRNFTFTVDSASYDSIHVCDAERPDTQCNVYADESAQADGIGGLLEMLRGILSE